MKHVMKDRSFFIEKKSCNKIQQENHLNDWKQRFIFHSLTDLYKQQQENDQCDRQFGLH